MTAATLSFRAPSEFAEQTKALAKAVNMTSSDYVVGPAEFIQER